MSTPHLPLPIVFAALGLIACEDERLVSVLPDFATDAGLAVDGGIGPDAGVVDPEPAVDAGEVIAPDAGPLTSPDAGVHWLPLTVRWRVLPEDQVDIFEQAHTLELMLECGDSNGTYWTVPWGAYATAARGVELMEARVEVLPGGRCKATVRGRDGEGQVIQWLTGYWGAPDRPYSIGWTEAQLQNALFHGVLAPQPDIRRQGYVWILEGW